MSPAVFRHHHGLTQPLTCDAIDADSLDRCFDQIGPAWVQYAKRFQDDSSAVLSHTASAAPNNSDFGLMLCWDQLIAAAAANHQPVRIETTDPWLYLHFKGWRHWSARLHPWLLARTAKMAARGFLARSRYALGACLASLRNRHRRGDQNGPTILTYGHPASTAQGYDAYFGDLRQHVPNLGRMLHVDTAQNLCDRLDDSACLHGWGSPLYALCVLPFKKWRPSARHLTGQAGLLVRRAAALEGSTGQAAAIAWQIHCQMRWLRRQKPTTVIWPWENHGWERALVAEARKLGIRTIGHQHSVIGQQFNIGCITAERLPDQIATNGPSGCQQLARRGIAAEKMAVAGTLRFKPPADGGPVHNPDGPVFLAVPFDHRVARQMIDALRPVAESGVTVLMRDHPLFPVPFAESANFRRAPGPLPSMDGVRCVIFAATTVGLESLLAGLPTIRFIPSGCVAVDILPDFVRTPTAHSATVLTAVLDAVPPPPLQWTDVFAEPDLDFWRRQLT